MKITSWFIGPNYCIFLLFQYQQRGIILNYVNFIVSSGEEIERLCVQFILVFTNKDFIRLNSLIFSSDRGVDRFPRDHLHTLAAFQQLWVLLVMVMEISQLLAFWLAAETRHLKRKFINQSFWYGVLPWGIIVDHRNAAFGSGAFWFNAKNKIR